MMTYTLGRWWSALLLICASGLATLLVLLASPQRRAAPRRLTYTNRSKTPEELRMRKKLASLLLVLSLLGLALPLTASAQDRGEYGGFIRRDKNGIRVGQGKITLFD